MADLHDLKDLKDDQIVKLLLQRIKHLESIARRYGVEDWENFTTGDAVRIDNSDSLHDGIIGEFLTHTWSLSGYVRLVVRFPDGKTHSYLPSHVLRATPDQIPAAPTPKPTPAPAPVATQQELSEDAKRVIEAVLGQLAKMPPATRKAALTRTIDPSLLSHAMDLAKQRGIIPS